MNNSLEKALKETWEKKEKFYEDTKHLSIKEIIEKIEGKTFGTKESPVDSVEEKRIIKLDGFQSPEPMLSASQVAELLGVSVFVVRKLTYNKEIPFYKLPGKQGSVRFRESEVAAWIKTRRVKAR